jgi:glycosidase
MTFPLVLQEGMFNFCGNHDVPRMLDYAQFSKKKTIMAHAISLMMPGNFNLYYGDERFLSGAADPFNRKVFPWYDIDREDDDILTIKQLIHYYNEMDRTELVLENTVIENNLLRLIFDSKSCNYELIINISEEFALIETNPALTNGNYFEGNLILNLYELAIIERKKQI